MSLSPRIRSLLVAIVLLGVALFLNRRYAQVSEYPVLAWYDRVVIFLVSPPSRLITSMKVRASGIVRHYLFLVGASQENERLWKQVEEMELKEMLLDEVERENARLRGLLDLQSAVPGPLVAARVVGFSPMGEFQLLLIDKGSEEGIRRRDPVIAPEGLVGQISRLEPHVAQVLLVTDPTSAVDGRVVRTGARGLVVGKARRLELEHDLFLGAFEFLNRTASIEVGDVVETTGLDGIFPAGIPVGGVHEVMRKKYDVFLGAEIIPRVDPHRLREVFVVRRP